MSVSAITLRPDYVRWDAPVSDVEGVNERCIELPLGLEVADLGRPGWVLDAGCALLPAVSAYPKSLPFQAHVVHLTQDISREQLAVVPGLTSFVSGDLRDLSIFADRAFERVVCLSTLEHVGLDNRQYGGANECDPRSATQAMRELWRVTGRQLVMSIPFASEPWMNHKWRYFTAESLRTLTDPIGGCVSRRFYVHRDDGWSGPLLHPIIGQGPRERVQQIAVVKVTR